MLLFVDMFSAAPSPPLLRALRSLLLAIVAVIAIQTSMGVIGTYTSSSFTSPVTIRPSVSAQVTVLTEQPRGQTYADARVDVTESSDTAVRTAVMLVDTATALIVIAVLVTLLRLINDALSGLAFRGANVDRIRLIGWLALSSLPLTILVGPLIDTWAQDRLGTNGVVITASWLPALIAAGVFALARVWQRGVELQELEEHTV